MVARQEVPRGGVALREALHEAEEEAQREALMKVWSRVRTCIDASVSNIPLIHDCYPTTRSSISSPRELLGLSSVIIIITVLG